MKSDFSRRKRFVALLPIFLGTLILARLYFIQIVRGEEFTERAERQYATSAEGLFDRGSIFFTARDKSRISAASLASGFILAINPSELRDSRQIFRSLSAVLPLDEADFFAKAEKRGDPYEELARRISQTDADAIKALRLHGVSLYKERWRSYPGGGLAAHLLGFVGWSGDGRSGRYGLEQYYDDILRRGSESVYRNFFGEVFLGVTRVIGEKGRGGGDVVTSIEPSVSQILEDTLTETQERFFARAAGGIVMDPKTGRTFALSLIPSFNPNEFGKETDVTVFGNFMTEGVFEMGSIMKPITLAAGLDAEVITATSTYTDAGSLVLSGKRIGNFDGKARGRVSMQEVLNQSLNTGAAHVALLLGADRFRGYFRRFGFGEETGIDLPNEASGLLGNLLSGRDIELATASYGQGIAVTPIQMVRALSALANGGFRVTPQVATEIISPLGLSRSIKNNVRVPVLRPESAEEITRMLVEVVDKALVGGAYKLPHHTVAAKTGTALIANPDSGGYYEDRFLHTFFGYFPAYEPRFIVFLILLEPKGTGFAAYTLTEPFMKIAKFLINYYDIPPDR